MSCIVSVECAGGGMPATCCPEKLQNRKSMNVTIRREHGEGTERVRLCDDCARNLYHKMKHYVP